VSAPDPWTEAPEGAGEAYGDGSGVTEPPGADIATTAIPATHDHGAETGRGRRLAALAGATALTGYVYLLDPDKGGAYPLCPSRTLLGIDCPMCGGLRGTNALLHGRIGEALDHNLLLPAILGVLAVLFGFWLLPLIGRPARRLPVPRWLGVAALTALVAFGIARNLPFDSLSYLDSGT
jgi:hypothetical protein